MGRDREALQVLDRALEINPQETAIWLEKGSILIENKNYNEACDNYRQSREVIPNSPEILSWMKTVGCRMKGGN